MQVLCEKCVKTCKLPLCYFVSSHPKPLKLDHQFPPSQHDEQSNEVTLARMVRCLRPLGYNVRKRGRLQDWAETPLSFIRRRAWSKDIERKMGEIERETAVIRALTHSSRDPVSDVPRALSL